jgi:hypothetical protein
MKRQQEVQVEINLAAAWKRVANFTLRHFTPGKRALFTHWIADWVAPRHFEAVGSRIVAIPTGNQKPFV